MVCKRDPACALRWPTRALCAVTLVSGTLCAQDGSKGTPRQAETRRSAATQPARTEGPGLAARYPGDRGITRHPAVLFATGFESGVDGGMKRRRKGVEILEDPEIAHTGKSCARITATRGKDTGGDLVYEWKKGVDRCFLRFYCKFDPKTVTPHHFVHLGGHMPTYKFRFGGGAGIRPPGGADGKFGTTIEPPDLDRTPGGRKGWMFYTYWHEMRSWQTPQGESAGKPNAWYGNNFLADHQRPFVGRGRWICVEILLQVNPIGHHDGQQAVWIDGRKVGHWGPGYPVGSWIRDRFVTSGPWNKKPVPFEGFSWRTDERLRIQRAMLQWYVSDRAARKGKAEENIVYFDNVVIATEYIGPLAIERTKGR